MKIKIIPTLGFTHFQQLLTTSWKRATMVYNLADFEVEFRKYPDLEGKNLTRTQQF